SFGRGPLGHRAFIELFEGLGFEMVRLRKPIQHMALSPILFLEPLKETLTPAGTISLEEAVTQRLAADYPTVVVLPKWEMYRNQGGACARPIQISRVQDIVASLGMREEATPELQRGRLSGKRQDGGNLQVPGKGNFDGLEMSLPIPQSLKLPDDDSEILLGTRESALVVRYPDENGPLLIISDPDLLHNYNLHQADHAILLYELANTEFPSH
ncbi:MAG: hypothetical protein KJ645_14655, partial [Planctomycetes bacterium]|nr:hypothetical protein [Planctomycetota bacterium]